MTPVDNPAVRQAHDTLFQQEINKVSDFKFGQTVANVFDDMVNRSGPFYEEIQRMLGELTASYAKPGTDVYDLGCSTGTTLLNMDRRVSNDIRFVGIDDSPEMLAKCALKLREFGVSRPYELRVGDIQHNLPISNASVVVLCLTLQFIRPIYRQKLLQRIYDGLVPGGALLLVEKILTEDEQFNREYIHYYYDYKRRQHYSELEISQKREALENVLIPYKLSENRLLLQETGFSHVETFFQWYNFSGMIAIKNETAV